MTAAINQGAAHVAPIPLERQIAAVRRAYAINRSPELAAVIRTMRALPDVIALWAEVGTESLTPEEQALLDACGQR